MNVGIFNFITEYSMPITDLAREVEDRGFDSLWVPEHTHIPTSRLSPVVQHGQNHRLGRPLMTTGCS